jgi:hypothetical protein
MHLLYTGNLYIQVELHPCSDQDMGILLGRSNGLADATFCYFLSDMEDPDRLLSELVPNALRCHIRIELGEILEFVGVMVPQTLAYSVPEASHFPLEL